MIPDLSVTLKIVCDSNSQMFLRWIFLRYVTFIWDEISYPFVLIASVSVLPNWVNYMYIVHWIFSFLAFIQTIGINKWVDDDRGKVS